MNDNTTAHTPGPWQIYDTDGGAICITANTTVCGDGFTLTPADRALIAAAPALLDALERVLRWHVARSKAPTSWTPAAKAAIAQARGQWKGQ